MSSMLSAYEHLLVGNATRISSIESSLRSLTWFLPGRFQDSELASEALYSLLNILGSYHDTVLLRTVSVLPPPLRPRTSSHARYTRHFTTTSPSYSLFARLLTLITYTELLIEMTLKKRKGSDVAQKATIAIEGIKAVLRLASVKVTDGRSCVNPPIPEREVDPSVLDLHRPHVVGEPPHARISFAAAHPRSSADVVLPAHEEVTNEYGQEYWKGVRTGHAHPTIKSIRPVGETVGDFTLGGTGKETVKEYLSTRVLTLEDVKRPEDLVARLRGSGRLAEMIWILRPVIYTLALRHYGRRHTLPYLLSLSLEYLSFSLRKSSRSPRHVLSEAEKEEDKKRQRAFWWYVVRGPVWESWTKPQLENLASKFEDKPLIGIVSTLVGDYLPLIDDYYFYTS